MSTRKPFKVMPKSISSKPSDNSQLSQDQIKFYWDNGYLVIKGLIDYSVLYSCKRRFIQICNGVVEKGNITVMKELSLINSGAKGEDLINKIQDILYDDVLSTFTEYPPLLDVVSALIGSTSLTAVQSMLINKPPKSSRHPPHQDLHYFPFRPVDKIIAAWAAIDHVHKDNGCLYVVPGSHKAGKLYQHGYPPPVDGVMNKMYHGILSEQSVCPPPSRVYLAMEPCDLVLFHPLLVHGSGPNVTEGYRKAITCHYAASDCEYIDVTGTEQENIAREVEDIAKKRGYTITFADVWKYRSKQVRGIKSNL